MAGAELASDGPLRPAAEPPSASSSREPLAASRLVRPPMTPRPHAQQRWVHSCCSVAKLERALSDSSITAIEADIMLGTPQAPSPVMVGRAKRPGVIGSGSVGALVDALVPVMAHPRLLQKLSRSPPPPKSDLTFVDFLERCIEDGSRHLKLDFKHMGAVEPCLQLLASKWHLLHSNGQVCVLCCACVRMCMRRIHTLTFTRPDPDPDPNRRSGSTPTCCPGRMRAARSTSIRPPFCLSAPSGAPTRSSRWAGAWGRLGRRRRTRSTT